MVGTDSTKIGNCKDCAYWEQGKSLGNGLINIDPEWGSCNRTESDIAGAIDEKTMAWCAVGTVDNAVLSTHGDFACNQYMHRKLLVLK